MSLTEIKAELGSLSRSDRLSLAEHLEILNHLEEPAVREEMSAAMSRMDQGRKVSEEDVMAAHDQLLAEGR